MIGGVILEELKVIIISDSLGETGTIVAKAGISQFKTQDYEIKRYPYIDEIGKLKEILDEVSSFNNLFIIYTLVDKRLIEYIKAYVRDKGIRAIDIMSPILGGLSEMFGREPTYEAGTIRKLDEAYFSRVAAIEFAVKYDDGKNPRGVEKADLVLIGISRTSKTPLSMYLANKNIKVANIPLVIESEPPKEIFQIPAKRIIGLTNSPEKLNEIREERLKSLGLPSGSNYASLGRILDELDFSEKIMRRIGCPVINVANKAIEETSEIIISLLKKNGIKFN